MMSDYRIRPIHSEQDYAGALARVEALMDTSIFRVGQIVYLPNRGEYYEHDIRRVSRLPLGEGHPIVQRRKEREAQRITAEAEARRESERKAAERAARQGEGDVSPVDHFNVAHTVEQLLDRYGYRKLGGSNDWRSPIQTSGSYATRCYGEYWVSLSGSDAAAGIGCAAKTGARHGDAFDLFVYFEHGGKFEDAVRAYAREAGLSGPAKVPGFADRQKRQRRAFRRLSRPKTRKGTWKCPRCGDFLPDHLRADALFCGESCRKRSARERRAPLVGVKENAD